MWSKFWRGAAIVYVALALAPLVVFALYYPITEGWRLIAGSDDWYTRDAVTSPERAAELAKKGLVEQIVTLAEPVGLRQDETKQFDLYAIGVGQTTLPEEIDATTTFGLLSAPPPPSASGLKYASSMPVTGQFNNVVLFEPKTGVLTKVFTTRQAVSKFSFASGPGFEVLLVLATDKDSNKDGRLSVGDLHDMYVYAIKERTLHKVAGLRGDPNEIIEMPGPFVVVRAVQDTNRDGVADNVGYTGGVPEPTRLFRVNLTTYTAEPLLPGEMLDELQKTLDGRVTTAPAR